MTKPRKSRAMWTLRLPDDPGERDAAIAQIVGGADDQAEAVMLTRTWAEAVGLDAEWLASALRFVEETFPDRNAIFPAPANMTSECGMEMGPIPDLDQMRHRRAYPPRIALTSNARAWGWTRPALRTHEVVFTDSDGETWHLPGRSNAVVQAASVISEHARDDDDLAMLTACRWARVVAPEYADEAAGAVFAKLGYSSNRVADAMSRGSDG